MNPAIIVSGDRYDFSISSAMSSRKAVAWSSMGKKPEIGASELSQLFVTHTGQTAFGVLHDDDGVDTKYMTRQCQTAQDIVGDTPACIADDVRVT